MKQRYIGVCLIAMVSIICCVLAYPGYSSYAKYISSLNKVQDEIELAENRINDLEWQYQQIKGSNVPQTLRAIIGYLSGFENIEIISIRSFSLDGDKLEILRNVTSVSDTMRCDGYEITIAVDELVDFIRYLDKANLTFHSADFLFGAKMAILRVRVGDNSG